MRLYSLYLIFTTLLIIAFQRDAAAQGLINDPFAGAVKWSLRLEDQTSESVTVIMDAEIKDGLHVFSVVPPEKDANLPTVLELDPTAKGVAPDGKLKESGKLHSEYDDVFETQVRYFKGHAQFSQQFKIKSKGGRIKGQLVYQVCDEEGMCASQKQPFDFKLP